MAGSVPTIKTRLEADVDGFIANVKKAGQAGERAMNQIKAAGGSLADGGARANHQLRQIGLHALEGERATLRFREVIHVAHPILEAAGLGLGNLGAFARLASTGLTGLAAGGIGAALVGFAKLADEISILNNHVSATVGGGAIGAKTFADLQHRAKGLGVDVGDLSGAFQDLFDAQHKGSTILFRAAPGHEEFLPNFANPGRAVSAAASFYETIGAGAASQEEAKKASADFAASIKDQGALTLQAFQQLEKASPGGALSFAKIFAQTDVTGFESQLRTATISTETLIARLTQIGPVAEKAFLAAKENGGLFGDALSSLLARIKEDIEHTAGKPAQTLLRDETNRIGNTIDQSFKDINTIKDQVHSGKFKNPFSFVPSDKSISGAALKIDTNAIIGDIINAGGRVAAAIDSVANAIKGGDGGASFKVRFGEWGGGGAPPNAPSGPDWEKNLKARGYVEVSPGKWQTSTGIPHERIRGAEEESTAPVAAITSLPPVTAPTASPYSVPVERIRDNPLQSYRATGDATDAYAAGGPISLPGFARGGVVGDDSTLEWLQTAQDLTNQFTPGSYHYVMDDAGNFLTPGEAADAKEEEKRRKKFGNSLKAGLFDIQSIFSGDHNRGLDFADGGLIRGPGTGTSDSILIRASHGEGIVNARGMVKIGKEGLDAINGYADGGLVDLGGLSPRSSSSLSVGDLSGGSSDAQRHVIDLHVNGRSIGTIGDHDDVHLSRLVSGAVNEKLNQILPRQSAAQ